MAFNRQISKDCPCVPDCPRRNAECHGVCEDYKKWRQTIEERNKKIRAENDALYSMPDQKKREIWRHNRYRARAHFSRQTKQN